MSLLAPWALGLAALAVLPVALHLLRRDTRKRVPFPAIRYLRQARDRSARALKLRDRLLLLTRAALVILLAIAAAGPLVGRGRAPDHFPSDLVLLLDNSGSMNRVSGQVTLLDRQRSRALELLDAADPGDRFWVLPAVGPPLALDATAANAAEALGRLEATDAAADLTAGVRESLRLLPSRGERPREIVVMSDLQASSVGGAVAVLPEDVRLLASGIQASTDNRAVTELEVDTPGPGRDGAALVRLAGLGAAGEGDPDTVEVRLSVNGEAASIARVASGVSAVLRLPDRGLGEFAVSAEIPPSGLRADDRRFAVVRTLPPPVVAHAGPPDSYAGQALAALQTAGLISLGEPGDRPSAWLVEGVPPEPLSTLGGSAWVLIPPEDDALIARFNTGLQRLGIPWRIEVADVPGETALQAAAAVPGLESIRIRGRHVLRAVGSESDEALLYTVGGSPWLVGGQLADRHYVLVGSPLVPLETELPVTVAMVPLLEAILFRWTGLGGSLPAPVPAGLSVILPRGANSVSAPDGRTVRVDDGSPYSPLRAGIHTVFEAGGDTSLLAVTVPIRESDLTAASPGDFVGALGSLASEVAVSDAEWRSAMYGSRRGAAITAYLIALALALVLLEATLATPGERAGFRRRPETAGPVS